MQLLHLKFLHSMSSEGEVEFLQALYFQSNGSSPNNLAVGDISHRDHKPVVATIFSQQTAASALQWFLIEAKVLTNCAPKTMRGSTQHTGWHSRFAHSGPWFDSRHSQEIFS